MKPKMFVFALLYSVIVLTVASSVGAVTAPHQVESAGSLKTVSFGIWTVNAEVTHSSVMGAGIARFTISEGDFSLFSLPEHEQHISFSASTVIPPLLGAGVSALITRRSSHHIASFWPSLLGAYAGSVIVAGSLALLGQGDHFRAEPGFAEKGGASELWGFRGDGTTATAQILLPALFPGLGAVAGYALSRVSDPDGFRMAFLLPTLFASPAEENHFILGVQLIKASF